MTPDLRSQATRTTSSRNSMGQSISTTPSLQTTLPNKPNQTSPTRTTNPTHQYCDLAEENPLCSHHAITPEHAKMKKTPQSCTAAPPKPYQSTPTNPQDHHRQEDRPAQHHDSSSQQTPRTRPTHIPTTPSS